MPAFRPKRLPFLIDVSAQWIVSEDESRIAVLNPATTFGSSVPWAGHGSLLYSRGAVGLGRTVVLVLAVRGDGGGFHQALPAASMSTTTCSIGFAVARRTRSIRSLRSHPDRVSGWVEITISSTR